MEQSAKKKKPLKKQRIKLLFWTSVRKMTEKILNKTPLKFSIYVSNLPRTSEIIQDTHE